jgi:hypothetical protein
MSGEGVSPECDTTSGGQPHCNGSSQSVIRLCVSQQHPEQEGLAELPQCKEVPQCPGALVVSCCQ